MQVTEEECSVCVSQSLVPKIRKKMGKKVKITLPLIESDIVIIVNTRPKHYWKKKLYHNRTKIH